MAKSKPPGKRWSELTPAYRARLETAYKKGTFGPGYSSAGRAYAAGASRQVARGQASSKPGKLSEAQRKANSNVARKAKAWSDKHAQSKATTFTPPAGLDPAGRAEYARKYLDAMKELEKGWAPLSKRQTIDWDKVQAFFTDYELGDFDAYFGL